MMEEPNCERCGEALKWEFGVGKTPHLHHNHETGEIYGFTHPVCNPQAMEQEIERLRTNLTDIARDEFDRRVYLEASVGYSTDCSPLFQGRHDTQPS
jgi:hypothetical protein